ncbi:ladderlectin-like [Chaetodon auriga]|uniref:ladderlectin-like n=1 Tax=Chaetodon auriga TaxID=39042 RepID=UPI004032A4BA
MATRLILSVILCGALSIGAATVLPAVVQEENKSSPKVQVDSKATAVAERAPALFQARFDFCLDGWLSFRGNCYFLVNQPDTWGNAQKFCSNYDANLASVHNIWQYNFLQRMVKTGGHTFAWIGGYYFQDDWRWEDGSVFGYHNWGTSSSTASYQCLQLNSEASKGWSNHGCSLPFPFICQARSNCY